MIDVFVGILIVLGALFALIASIGLLKLPDVYMRMHAASKAGTLGSQLMLIALALHALEVSVTTRVIAGIVFFLLTTPVATHLLARAAYLKNHRPSESTWIDDYAAEVGSDRTGSGVE